MGIEAAPDAVLGDPFLLDATLHARRLESGVSISRGELHDGDTVMSGDSRIFVRTTRDAHLYLAFCSQQAADSRYAGFTVSPPQAAARTPHVRRQPAPRRPAAPAARPPLGVESASL